MSHGLRVVVISVVVAFLVLGGDDVLSSASDALSNSLPTTGTPTPRSAPIDRYALILVVDGARSDEFDLAHMPNLAKLVARGTMYTQASVGQLPSITETSHATIGSGVLPRAHGILGDTWRVPGTNRMAPNLLDGNLDRTGYIDRLMQQANTASLAGIVHRHYKGSVVVSLSGHKVYAASSMGAGHADYVAFGANDSRGHFVPTGTPGRTPDKSILSNPALDFATYPRKPGLENSWVTTLATAMLARYRPRVMMVNFPETDNAGHEAGLDPRVISPIMQAFDVDLGRLEAAYRKAKILSKTEIIVTSDHGMVPATHIVSEDKVAQVMKKAGADPLYVGHGDYSAIWLKDPRNISKATNALVAAKIPHVSAIYAKNPQGNYALVSSSAHFGTPTVNQAYADLLSTFRSPASADIVLLYDENTITMTKTLIQQKRKGDHEGATWGAQHISLFMAGPGIRGGYNSSFPAHLVDIAPTVERLLGARPTRQDGIVLTDAMTSPPATSTTQNAGASQRSQDVAALEQQAAHSIATDRAP